MKTKTKQIIEQKQNQRNGDHVEGFQWGGGEEEQGGKGTGNKKHNWWVQKRQEEVQNIIGNGEAKELVCTTHGHELRVGDYWREGGYQVEGGKV